MKGYWARNTFSLVIMGTLVAVSDAHGWHNVAIGVACTAMTVFCISVVALFPIPNNRNEKLLQSFSVTDPYPISERHSDRDPGAVSMLNNGRPDYLEWRDVVQGNHQEKIRPATGWGVTATGACFLLVGLSMAAPATDSDPGGRILGWFLLAFATLVIVRSLLMGVRVENNIVRVRRIQWTRTYDNVQRVGVETGPVSGGRVPGAYALLELADGKKVKLDEFGTYLRVEKRKHTAYNQAVRIAKALDVPGPPDIDSYLSPVR